MEEIAEVEINTIALNPFQPRKDFSLIELKELAQSIQEVGLVHPPVVRKTPDGYELISGERRVRAAEIAGMARIHVLVRPEGAALSAQMALIENIQRVDLNPLEIAEALRRLINEFGLSQDELAQRVGKKRSTLANYLRLLTLSDEIQDGLSQGEISMGHAKAILSLDKEDERKSLFERILDQNLSVRDTEKATQKKPRFPQSPQDCHVHDLQKKLQERLGTKVTIQNNSNKGRICIDYYSLDDLDRVLEIIRI